MKIKNNVFTITGAGSGIGMELAKQVLQRGGRVAAVDLSNDNLKQLQTESDAGNNLSVHALDISDKDKVAELPAEVVAKHGQLDGVINCAGIIQPFVRVNELAFEQIDKVMDVNFYGTLFMTKAFLPKLLQRPEAHIVNVSSMGGFLPVPGQSIYGASKAAVKLMTEGLYAELLDTNVHVSLVFPGATQTNITKNSGVDAPNVSKSQQQKFTALPAEKAAQIILDGIEKNKPQIFTGKDSKTMNRLYRLNPIFATKLIAKQMKSLLD